MKKIMLTMSVAVLAAFASAQDEESDNEGQSPAAAAKSFGGKILKAPFETLPICSFVEQPAEIMLPGADWVAVEQGRRYPLGASFRTRGNGKIELKFGPESKAVIEGESSFRTRFENIGSQTRTIELTGGRLSLDLADNLPEGAMFVSAPGFMVKNPAGESVYDYADKGDGDEATVRCVTGSLSVEGRHFEIPAMRAANEFRIRTSQDHLLTFLYGNSGDIVMKLDQGVREKNVISDDLSQKSETEKASMEWHLSPKTKVVISRALPAIGERMSVHTMAFDAAGEKKSECCFCEGRADVNSGELVAAPKADKSELAKQAAEATETTEAADAEDDAASEGGDKKSEGEGDSSSAESAE